MRRFFAIWFGFVFGNGYAVDFPYGFQLGTNEFELPPKTQAIWMYNPGKSPPGKFQSGILPAVSLGEGRVRFVTTKREEYGFESDSYQKNHYIIRLLVHDHEPSIVAGRLMVDGRWQSIRPVLLETGFGFGWNFKPDFPELTITNIPPGGVYRFEFNAIAKKETKFEIVANRIGSQLDPVVRILDSKGHSIVEKDDGLVSGRDAILSFLPKTKGFYTLEIRDVANGSGADYFFCLRANSNEPKTLPALGCIIPGPWKFLRSDREEVRRALMNPASGVGPWDIPFEREGSFEKPSERDSYKFSAREDGKVIVSAETRRFGSPCDAHIALYDEDKKLLAESVGFGTDGPSITNRVTKGRTYSVEVREISRLSGPEMKYWLCVSEHISGIALSTDLERAIFSKDGEAKLKIACNRFDYDGPITFKVDGLSGGLAIEGLIPEKKSEGELTFKTKSKAEAFQVRVKGVTKDGKEFPVSTMPALRKLYPLMMFPPAAMDGWIAVNPP